MLRVQINHIERSRMSRNAIQRAEDGAPAWCENLTDRERAFVTAYVVTLSPTEAAIRAKLGKTRKSSTEIASRMRKKPEVAAAISRLMGEQSGVTGAGVINEIARIAFSKMPDFARVEKGALVITDTNQLTEDQQAAISEISETVGEGGRTVRVKLHDKLAALDKLAKVLSLYREKVEVSGPKGGPIEMIDAKARLMVLLNLPAGSVQPMPMVEIQPPLRRITSPKAPAVRIIDAD
jgi:phage terminase small subunit